MDFIKNIHDSFVKETVKSTFRQLFAKIARELSVPVSDVQIGIRYSKENISFTMLKKYMVKKDFNFEDYTDLTADNTLKLLSTIAQAGIMFAKELNCEIEYIAIILSKNGDAFPRAALLQNKGLLVADLFKIREINIEKEIF